MLMRIRSDGCGYGFNGAAQFFIALVFRNISQKEEETVEKQARAGLDCNYITHFKSKAEPHSGHFQD